MTAPLRFIWLALALSVAAMAQPEIRTQRLADIFMRDACILADHSTRTYYLVASTRGGVRAYTSKDLQTWEGPHAIFRFGADTWEGAKVVGIWAPELHKYREKYYLFLTYNTDTKFPEQWRNWRPRVKRASSILVSDSPLGPFKPFGPKPTLPEDMMTLDGTLWVEDGVPYMIFCHEWVQVVNGTMLKVPLTPDLSATAGEPERLFFANDAPWAQRNLPEGCWVTDGAYLYTSKSGRLFMPWSSFSATGYTVGLAVSDSGKLAGPWRQQAEPIFSENGGHSMLFTTFEGQLMMALHSPNEGPNQRIHLFEMEDTGESLRIIRRFPDR